MYTLRSAWWYGLLVDRNNFFNPNYSWGHNYPKLLILSTIYNFLFSGASMTWRIPCRQKGTDMVYGGGMCWVTPSNSWRIRNFGLVWCFLCASSSIMYQWISDHWAPWSLTGIYEISAVTLKKIFSSNNLANRYNIFVILKFLPMYGNDSGFLWLSNVALCAQKQSILITKMILGLIYILILG